MRFMPFVRKVAQAQPPNAGRYPHDRHSSKERASCMVSKTAVVISPFINPFEISTRIYINNSMISVEFIPRCLHQEYEYKIQARLSSGATTYLV